jgi:uncharacterized phage-like protein YoqJ
MKKAALLLLIEVRQLSSNGEDLMYTALALSGYKPHELGVFQEKHEQLPYLKKAIKKKLSEMIESWGVEWVITSGQAGVELWGAEAALELREEGVPLQIATLAPFYNQEEKFPEATKELYEYVWQHSDYKDYITKRPYESPAQLRQKNDFIILKTDALFLLYDEMTEGTPKFYAEAAEKRQKLEEYPVFYLTPEDIEDLIREEMDDWG